MLLLAQSAPAGQTVSDAANTLKVSKIYLEQVFGQLKKAGIIRSQKGSGGGYFLKGSPHDITAYDILKATEIALFEAAVGAENEKLQRTLIETVWFPLDTAVKRALSAVTLQDILDKSKTHEDMFYI